MLFVIVSPSLAFLDQAAPLAFQFKTERPNEPIHFVFPKPKTTRQLTSEWLPIKIAENIGSRFHFPITDRVWISATSMSQTRRLSKLFDFLISAIQRFGDLSPAFLLSVIDRLLLLILSLVRIRATIGFSGYSSEFDWSIIDIYVIEKSYFADVAKVVTDSNILAIRHGLNPYEGHKLEDSNSASLLKNRNGLKLVVCAYSAQEVPLFRESLDIEESDVLVTGIPRHHPEWIDHISREIAQTTESERKVAVLLVSAPAGPSGTFLSQDRKSKYIHTVREFALKNDLKILVKRHPKELEEKVYERVLKKRDRGTLWDFTEAHALENQPTVLFAVSFFSSVCLDLLQLSIPTLEILGLLKLSDWDGPDKKIASREYLGDQTLDVYRRYGLALSATSEPEFLSAAKLIMKRRKATTERLRKNYASTYLYPPLSPAAVVAHILRA